MDLAQLETVLEKEPGFRTKIAKTAVFKDLIENWSEATSLSTSLREKLHQECPLEIKAVLCHAHDKQTTKALLTLKDGLKIETVLMRVRGNRNTVCVSTQVGCSLQCGFCATGKMGYKRNLTSLEIVEQVLLFARLLKKEAQKITNVVFMGMGEPFLNYENVLSAVKLLNDNNGLNIGARHLSISTSGIVPGIKRLSDEPLQVNLAVSLHAPTDELRSKLMPLNQTYPLGLLIASISDYLRKTNRKVMFEYLMLEGVNDHDENAYQLIDLLKNLPKPLYMVNLIKYNATGDFKPSPEEKIKRFKNLLQRAGIETTQRHSFGEDIAAACGQLAAKN